MGWALDYGFWFHLFFADSRRPTHVPVLFRPPSWRPSHFLLLVQEKVTKENTPSVPRPPQSGGCAAGGRGFADRPSMACGKSGAIPRAARARARPVRPPFAASQRVPRAKAKQMDSGFRRNDGLGRFAALLCTALLCSSLPGPSRSRQARGGK